MSVSAQPKGVGGPKKLNGPLTNIAVSPHLWEKAKEYTKLNVLS